jgi:protein SCO1/2
LRTGTLVTMAACLAALGVPLSGCGSSAMGGTRTALSASAARDALQGGLIVSPPVPAPPLGLPNYTGGRAVVLRSLRGRAVFVTFVYTHCPDVCPLIVSDLAAAQRMLGRKAHAARFIAVTIDPRRDTPGAVRTFLTARGAARGVAFLLGSSRALARVWAAWHVTIRPGGDATLVHSSVVYGIDGRGMIRIAYPANFTAAQIVHDVPLLAGS